MERFLSLPLEKQNTIIDAALRTFGASGYKKASVSDIAVEEIDDIYYLKLEELKEVIKTNKLDYRMIKKRKEDYEIYRKLTPPRVITSDGEDFTANMTQKIFRKGLWQG